MSTAVTTFAPENSTNVRSQLLWVRRLLGALELVSTELAARTAWWLWRSPRRFDAPARERELLAKATALRIPVASGHLSGWRWGEGPPVLLVHGWEGRGAQLGSFVEPLVDAGFSVWTFDAPAHGATAGRTASLPAFADAVAATARASGPLAGLVAHSMGAAASAWALAGGLDCRRVVFVAPPDASLVLERFQRLVGISDRVRRRMECLLEEVYGTHLSEVSGPRLGESIRAPLLVVHDRDDQFVPWSDGQAFASSWTRASLMSTEGLGHHRILRDLGVIRRVVAFFEEAR